MNDRFGCLYPGAPVDLRKPCTQRFTFRFTAVLPDPGDFPFPVDECTDRFPVRQRLCEIERLKSVYSHRLAFQTETARTRIYKANQRFLFTFLLD